MSVTFVVVAQTRSSVDLTVGKRADSIHLGIVVEFAQALCRSLDSLDILCRSEFTVTGVLFQCLI